MKEFLKHIGSLLTTYPQIRLSRNDEILIRDETMKHLGLNNLNQMRDRYEGQAFFDKTIMNVGGLISIQKHLKLPVEDITKINFNEFRAKLKIDNEEIDILVFPFGSLPLIDVDEIKNLTFFVIQKDRITYSLCGFTDAITIKNNLVSTSVEKSSQANNMNFIGFKELKKAEDLIVKK